MDRLGVMMAMLVMWLVITTNLSGVVTQSVRLGGCGVEEGIFSCSKTGTADIITSIQTDVNTIDVIDIFHCNMSWISEEVFAGFSNIKEVAQTIMLEESLLNCVHLISA